MVSIEKKLGSVNDIARSASGINFAKSLERSSLKYEVALTVETITIESKSMLLTTISSVKINKNSESIRNQMNMKNRKN